MRDMLMKLWEVFVDPVAFKDGMLADREGQCADWLPTAWDATSGRIPIL